MAASGLFDARLFVEKNPLTEPVKGFTVQGYKDSNLEMTESESVALPFGDSPLCDYFMHYT